MNENVITVWRDGTWLLWRNLDAEYATDDPDWLVNIPVGQINAVKKSNIQA